MRKQIAAANWKMNLTYQQGAELLKAILSTDFTLTENQVALFAVPFPYLELAIDSVNHKKNCFAAAQNCSDKKAGAYTGEVSAEMLQSWTFRTAWSDIVKEENILERPIRCFPTRYRSASPMDLRRYFVAEKHCPSVNKMPKMILLNNN